MRLASILNFDQKTFVDGLNVQFRCLRALMIREMMMRYGRNSLGFVWVFIEPMLLCVGLWLAGPEVQVLCRVQGQHPAGHGHRGEPVPAGW